MHIYEMFLISCHEKISNIMMCVHVSKNCRFKCDIFYYVITHKYTNFVNLSCSRSYRLEYYGNRHLASKSAISNFNKTKIRIKF